MRGVRPTEMRSLRMRCQLKLRRGLARRLLNGITLVVEAKHGVPKRILIVRAVVVSVLQHTSARLWHHRWHGSDSGADDTEARCGICRPSVAACSFGSFRRIVHRAVVEPLRTMTSKHRQRYISLVK